MDSACADPHRPVTHRDTRPSEALAMMDYTSPLQAGAAPKGVELNISATAQPQVILQFATLQQDGSSVSPYMTTGSFPDGTYPTASTADPTSVHHAQLHRHLRDPYGDNDLSEN